MKYALVVFYMLWCSSHRCYEPEFEVHGTYKTLAVCQQHIGAGQKRIAELQKRFNGQQTIIISKRLWYPKDRLIHPYVGCQPVSQLRGIPLK